MKTDRRILRGAAALLLMAPLLIGQNSPGGEGGCIPGDGPGPGRFSLTVHVVGQGTVEPGSGTFEPDEEVTLTVTAAGGWRFDHWEGDLTAGRFDHWRECTLPYANPARLVMDGGKTVTAVLVERRAETETFDLGDGVTLTVIAIPGGTFTMGSTAQEQAFFGNENNSFDDEGPQHTVTVSPFAMSETEVTQAQFGAVMGYVPTIIEDCGGGCFNDVLADDHPAAWASWEEAVAFCDELADITGRSLRLPTEAEWEYACRAGTTTAFYSGDTEEGLDESAWYGQSASRTTPQDVATNLPNAFGLYDMHGNVWEWVGDWYWAYSSEAQVDPAGPSEVRPGQAAKLVRGGAYSRPARHCRSATRYRFGTSLQRKTFNVGFRVACD